MNQVYDEERRAAQRKLRVNDWISFVKFVKILNFCVIENSKCSRTISSSNDRSNSSRTRCDLWRKTCCSTKVHIVDFPQMEIWFSFSLYNRLLDEQAQRFKLEKNFQSYENLNVDQLKERLTRVENSNFELQQLVQQLLNQKPTYKNTIFIPRASK